MYIDYQSGAVNFTVLSKDKKEQYDFCIEDKEWKSFKDFIDTSMGDDSVELIKEEEVEVTGCCKIGPITNENYCPNCGIKIKRK